MKLLTFFMLIAITSVSAKSYSQLTTLTFNFDNVTVSQVFREIERNSDYILIYNEKTLDINRKVTLKADNDSINTILDKVFAGTKNSYKIFGRQIVFSETESVSPVIEIGTSDAELQQVVVTGTVTDKNGPIPGANVIVTGTTQGTITDIAGKYSIKIPQGSKSLTFSFIGMQPQEINVGPLTEINVTMIESSIALNEVMVIGYGTVKKNDATGSISVIGSDDFNKGALTSIQELIVGKSAGVVVTTSGGEPGGGSTIRIRGGSSLRASNDPLYVIDGFPVDNTGISGLSNPLSIINPNDIESMTILKDASATAIYGSRASNGVIIITTKKGKEGSPLRVNYTGNISVGVPVKFIDVLNASEFRTALQKQIDAGKITDVAINSLGNSNTDWQKEIYRNAISTDHNLGINGSKKNLSYRASIGYTDQNGLLKNSNMGRTTLDASINPTFFDKRLSISINLKGMDINNNFSNTGAIGSAIGFDPTQPINNGNTRFGGYTAWTNDLSDINGFPNNIAVQNPVALLKYVDNKSEALRTISNIQADYKFHSLPGLQANLNLGIDLTKSKGHNIIDSLASWSYQEPEKDVINYTQKLKTSLLEFYLNYQKKLDGISSNIDATAGYSWQHFYREGTNSQRPWVKTDGVYRNADTTEYKDENYLISFFGRLNYTLMDKYLLTVTLRDDGSSRFGKNTRWGLFPSTALAWKIKKEPFLANVKILSDLKLRLGYGSTGQQDIGGDYYPFLPTYSISTQGAFYQFGNTFYPTQRPNRYDPNLKWETTTTANIGIDFGFWNDRLAGSLDYYRGITNDLINEIPIAAGTNFSNYLVTNVGSLENKGLEANIDLKIISTKDIGWEISSSFSHNQNKITKLTRVNDPNYVGDNVGIISGGTAQINSIGYPANTFLLFKQVYDKNGMPIEGSYVDKTGNGGDVAGNNSNKYYLGNPAPKYLIGFSSKFNYKRFDVSFSSRLSLGNYVYNGPNAGSALYQQMYNQSGFTSNILSSVSKTNFFTAQFWSDIYLENASFFRMDNINIGYQFKKLISEKLNGRLNFTIQNAFVITKYSGLDPEVAGGIDGNIFPRPRTFILGITFDL